MSHTSCNNEKLTQAKCLFTGVQKRANTAGLILLSLEKPTCKVGLWPACGNVDLGRVPSIPWWVTVPKLVQTVWLMLNACFPPGSLEFWCMLGRGYLHNHPPIKTLGTESLMSFLGRQHLTRAVAIQCWRNEVCPMCLHWEGSLGGCT